ncbi:heavy-metal-associated domain-containing protein (plasmid) [Haloplanus ruber]|uniref:Heavy-metal-associated domain-containing protein n=1 Tax=Haloplanus ruber TaxID=869892 RepID=A0ABD6D1V9_9EURY|nr:cation transporter [Haloplanus ruber]
MSSRRWSVSESLIRELSASTVERALSNVDGVQHVEVHYATGRVEIEYDDSVTDPDAFAETIENQGYTPQPA